MRTTPEQEAQEHQNQYKAHIAGKIRQKWGSSVPADASDDDVLGVWGELNVPQDASQEDINAVLDETYGSDFAPAKLKDQRNLGEKVQDVAGVVGEAAKPIAANIGAALSPAVFKSMGKVAQAAGKSVPAQLGMAGYYGTQLAGEHLAGKKLEETAAGVPEPNIADLRSRGYSEQQIRNIVQGYVATQQSLMGDVQEMGERGVSTSAEALANAAVLPMGLGTVEKIAGGMAAGAAAKAGAKAAASHLAGKVTERALGGAAIGGAFGGVDSVVHRATEAVEAGEGADTILGKMTKGLLGPVAGEEAAGKIGNVVGAVAGQPTETAGAFAKGFGETWQAGAVLGGGFGAVEAGAQLGKGWSNARKVRAQEAVINARLVAVERFADDFQTGDVIDRFNTDVAEGVAQGQNAVQIASSIVAKLHPEAASTEAGLKAIATVATKLEPAVAAFEKTAQFNRPLLPSRQGIASDASVEAGENFGEYLQQGDFRPDTHLSGPRPEGLEGNRMPQGFPGLPPEPMAVEPRQPQVPGTVADPNLPPGVQGPLEALEGQGLSRPMPGPQGPPVYGEPVADQRLGKPGVGTAPPVEPMSAPQPPAPSYVRPEMEGPPGARPAAIQPDESLVPERIPQFAPPKGTERIRGLNAYNAAEPKAQPNPEIKAVADDYVAGAGRGAVEVKPAKANPERGAAIAKAYEEMPVVDEAAKPSYDALNAETAAQYKKILDAGYKIEFVDKDPYRNSAEMMQDLRDRKTLRVLKSTEAPHSFMSIEQNNIFRAVHDFFGHAREGYQFGPNGEESAFRAHAAMYSPDAVPALATETRGQNSWVNFGPEAAKPASERGFAVQKGALLPEEFYSDVLPKKSPGMTKIEKDLEGFPGITVEEGGDHVLIKNITTHNDVPSSTALKAAIASSDKHGVPMKVELAPQAGPKGGMIPIEKQAAWYKSHGFRELPGTGDKTVMVRESVGAHQNEVSGKLQKMADAAQARLDKRKGRLSAGVDPADIRDHALVLASDMFTQGLRTKAAIQEWARSKWGKEIEPVLDKLVARAQAHFERMFKTPGQAKKNLTELLELQSSGKHGADWYEKTADWAKKNFGQDADQMLRFLAVTSANGQTESGAALALKAFAQWKSGMPFSGFRGPAMMGQLQKAVEGKGLGEDTKIENFYQALAGDPDAVVLDRWMMDALNMRDKGGNLSPSNYRIYAEVVRELADQNGMTPRQFQAAVWEGARIRKAHVTEVKGGRFLTTKSGSAYPLEDLIDRRLAGMSIDEYVESVGGKLDQMNNLYEGSMKVRTGEDSGHTFDPKTWEPAAHSGYVTTLASTVIPKKELYPAAILKFAKNFDALVKEMPNEPFTVGLFDMGDGNYSIDFNVTLKDKARSVKLGLRNRQFAIGEIEKGQYKGDVPTGYDPKKHGVQFLPPKGARQTQWYKQQVNRIRAFMQHKEAA